MKKILIVDDQAELRELVDMTLRSSDTTILQAQSGADAVEMARREKPDVIIMDVKMPGELDGIEVTRILKGDTATKGITILMLTSQSHEIDKKRGYEAGADGYFTKPFSPLELIKKVEEILGE